MKFVLLVILSVLGTIWCDTHEQQKDYAEVLIDTIEQFADDADELLRNTDATTEKGRNAISIHANSLNFDIHFGLDCMQYLASENEESMALQAIVFKLNNITNELEKSVQDGGLIAKFKLQRSLKNIVEEAKKLHQIIRENQNHQYRSSVLRLLDDMVTAVQKLFFRAAVRAAPVKILLKTYIELARRVTNLYISLLNSEDVNIQNDVVQYSSKFSSAISGTANLLKDVAFMYTTQNEDDVKNIIHSLGKICYDNEEVLYNETSFHNINEHFRKTVVDVSKQLSKLIDAGFSKHGIFLKDENLIYVVFSDMYALSYKLMRNLEKTYENHVNARSN